MDPPVERDVKLTMKASMREAQECRVVWLRAREITRCKRYSRRWRGFTAPSCARKCPEQMRLSFRNNWNCSNAGARTPNNDGSQGKSQLFLGVASAISWSIVESSPNW